MPKSVFTDEYDILLDLLVTARRQAGVTQVELGKRLGKPQPWVSNIERGIRRIDVLEFIAVVRAFGGDPSKMIYNYNKMLPSRLEI